jgi:hypothetical protein
MLSNGLWHGVISGHITKVQITLSNLIVGDFGAATAMISFGAILGKCNV